jgi:hypothetical protein
MGTSPVLQWPRRFEKYYIANWQKGYDTYFDQITLYFLLYASSILVNLLQRCRQILIISENGKAILQCKYEVLIQRKMDLHTFHMCFITPEKYSLRSKLYFVWFFFYLKFDCSSYSVCKMSHLLLWLVLLMKVVQEWLTFYYICANTLNMTSGQSWGKKVKRVIIGNEYKACIKGKIFFWTNKRQKTGHQKVIITKKISGLWSLSFLWKSAAVRMHV